jgi:hypothetical protein
VGGKLLCQPRLANAGLAGDQEEAAVAVEGIVQASDELRALAVSPEKLLAGPALAHGGHAVRDLPRGERFARMF